MGAPQRRSLLLGSVVAAAFAANPAASQDRIEVTRGADRVVYGSCVPSLKAVNRTPTTVDYLEVALTFTLKSGESRTLELRSRYREGIERPIAPGATAALTVQPDMSRPLGVDCPDIVSIAVSDAVCEAAGKPCAGIISVDLGRR